MSDIERTTTPRGFLTYGEPLATDYGHNLVVRESSAAFGRWCWLFADGPVKVQPETRDPNYDRTLGGNHAYNEGHVGIHMDVEQAEGLVARLQAWIDDARNAMKETTDV